MQFNLSLDDFSPHPRAGLNFESIEWCDKLIELYPDIKIDLFVPAAYCRLGEDPCHLSKNKEWVERVNALPANYRVCFHGYYHRRLSTKHGNSNNDEWQFLNEQQAALFASHMINEFEEAGIRCHKTFRPPGWKISVSSAKVLTNAGFVIAGDGNYFNRISGKVSGLKWVQYNWDLVGPKPKSDCIVAYGHTSDWTNNYMDETRFNMVVECLKGTDKIDFRFIGDLV